MYPLSPWDWRRKLTAGLGSEGLWKLVAFELVKDLIDSEDKARVGNYLGSNKLDLASAGLGGGCRMGSSVWPAPMQFLPGA